MSSQFALQEEQVGQSAWGPCKHSDRLPDLLEVGLPRGEYNIYGKALHSNLLPAASTQTTICIKDILLREIGTLYKYNKGPQMDLRCRQSLCLRDGPCF